MNCEVISNPVRLQQLAGEWQSLAFRIPASTPFQLPCWQLTWWKHFGSGELRVLAFWSRGTLVGILPMFCHEWHNRRQLTLIGSGISDYLEPLILPDMIAEVVEQIGSYLSSYVHWNVCNWQDLQHDSPLAQLKTADGSTVNSLDEVSCSAVPLNGMFLDYWSERSSDLRRNIVRYGKKADLVGPVTFGVEHEAVSELLHALIHLHSQRWQKRGEAGMVELNRSGGFLMDVAQQFAREKILRIFSLTWQGKIVAISAGFLCSKVLYSYLSAFDPDYEILGFGRHLLYEALQYSYNNSIVSWNFLRGEESYKKSWGAVTERKSRVTLQRV